MSLKIALVLSVVFQFATAVISLTLIKRTKSNIAWWLISGGLVLMAFRRLFELFEVMAPEYQFVNGLLNSWTGVVISILMLISLSFIKRIFNIQKRFDELKRKNDSRVFSAILRTEEDQKHKFSKELHDGLGPLLSTVKMSLSAIANDKNSKNSNKILANAEHLIDESIKTIREISNNLSPQILNSFGLYKALQSFFDKFKVAEIPEIRFNSNTENQRFAYNIETILYRVICELITNTIKHANAKNIYLDLLSDSKSLSIRYLDDGQGFEYDEDNFEQRGLGLMNIKSRIRSLQGSCIIYSKPDEGFLINISVKIE